MRTFAENKHLVENAMGTRMEWRKWKNRLELCEDAHDSHLCELMVEYWYWLACIAKIALNSEY